MYFASKVIKEVPNFHGRYDGRSASIISPKGNLSPNWMCAYWGWLQIGDIKNALRHGEIWKVELQRSPPKGQPGSESEIDPIHTVQRGTEDNGNAVNSSESLSFYCGLGGDSPNTTSQKIARDCWGPMDFHKYSSRMESAKVPSGFQLCMVSAKPQSMYWAHLPHAHTSTVYCICLPYSQESYEASPITIPILLIRKLKQKEVEEFERVITKWCQQNGREVRNTV